MKATFLRVSISTLALVLLAAISAFSQAYTGLSFRAKATDTTAFNFPAGYGGMTYFNGRLWLKDVTGWFEPRKVVPALPVNLFVFGSGTGLTSSSSYFGNSNVFVRMGVGASTITDPLNEINNTFVFGESMNLNGNPSNGGTITDTGIFGISNTIGDGVSEFSGSSSLIYGTQNQLYNLYGLVGGMNARLLGTGSTDLTTGGGIAIGLSTVSSDATKFVTAAPNAVNISSNTSAQTLGNGALAPLSSIFGGKNNHIPSTSEGASIIGGNGITARSSDPYQVYVPNLNIDSTPLNDNALTQVLVRDPATGRVKYRSASSFTTPDALILGQTITRNPATSDEATFVNLDYDFTLEQEFTIRSYDFGDDTNWSGLRVATDGGNHFASLQAIQADGTEGYFRVGSTRMVEAKSSSPTNSLVMQMQTASTGNFSITGTGTGNTFQITGFKNGSFTYSGATSQYAVTLDGSGGAVNGIKFQVQNTTTTEPLIMLLTPTNSGIRLFGSGSATGNLLKAKNTLGDSQWGSMDLSLPAAVGTSVLRLVNGGLGAALSDPGANKILAWDDTDNSVGFWTLGAGLSYDHVTHTLSSGTANLDTYSELGTDFTSSWANIVIADAGFTNGGGLGTSSSSTFGVDGTEQASGVWSIGGTTTAGGDALNDIINQFTFGFGFQYEMTVRAALETLSDGTNTYIVRIGFADAYNTTAAIVDGAYFRYTHGTNSGKWQAVTISNGTETAQDTGITADVTTYHIFKVTPNAAGTSVSFSIDGSVTNTISTNVINSASRLTGKVITLEKTAGSADRRLHIDYFKNVTSRTTAR